MILSVSVSIVLMAMLEKVSSALQQLAPKDLRAFDVIGLFPGIDPLFWLWSQTNELPNGANFIGRAGATGEPVSHAVQYKDGRFRKDKIQSRDPKVPLMLLAFVSAGKDQRSMSLLCDLEAVLAVSPEVAVIVVDVQVHNLKPDEVRQKLQDVCCGQNTQRRIAAWLPYSFSTVKVPCQGDRYLFVGTALQTKTDVPKYIHSLLHTLAQMPGAVKAAGCVFPEGNQRLQFLDELRRRRMMGKQDAKTGKDTLEPDESVSMSAAGQIDADTEPEPARKKPRHTQDLPELLTSAVSGGWLPDAPGTLAQLEIVEHDYQKLPKQTPWTLVLAKILECRGRAYFAQTAQGNDSSFFTDASKAFNVSAGTLPRWTASSEILCLIAQSPENMTLRLLHAEEILAMYGYKQGTISLQLVKTFVGRMIAETTPVIVALVGLAVSSQICSEASAS